MQGGTCRWVCQAEQGQFDPFLKWPINVDMTLILVHALDNNRSVIRRSYGFY